MLLEYKGWSKPGLGAARAWRQGWVLATSAQPSPDPHRAHLYLPRDLLAVSLHPWRWFCHPPCFVSPGDSSLSWVRAWLGWALPPWAPELPLPGVSISLWSSAHGQIFAVPPPERILLPQDPSPCWLWKGPFLPRREAPAACAQLKMETSASYCSSAWSLGGSGAVPFGGQGV